MCAIVPPRIVTPLKHLPRILSARKDLVKGSKTFVELVDEAKARDSSMSFG